MKFDFVGKRYWFFAFSLLIIAAGMVGFFVNGAVLDISFSGGTSIEMKMNDDTFSIPQIETLMANTIDKRVLVQKSKTFNSDTTSKNMDILQLSIAKESGTLSEGEIAKVEEAIINEFKLDPKTAVISEISVEPFIGKEVMNNGIQAIFITSILIILYIWWRFKVMSGLSAGITAVIALLHDVSIMTSVYFIFKIPLNESFIAAILTILGYSMNDTVIIYDRIRENTKLIKKIGIVNMTNKSIIDTISRTINTMLTTTIAIVTVYVFAAVNNIQSIEEFTLPLMVGMIAGSYSSIFIASPLWVMWKQFRGKKVTTSAKPIKARA